MYAKRYTVYSLKWTGVHLVYVTLLTLHKIGVSIFLALWVAIYFKFDCFSSRLCFWLLWVLEDHSIWFRINIGIQWWQQGISRGQWRPVTSRSVCMRRQGLVEHVESIKWSRRRSRSWWWQRCLCLREDGILTLLREKDSCWTIRRLLRGDATPAEHTNSSKTDNADNHAEYNHTHNHAHYD